MARFSKSLVLFALLLFVSCQEGGEAGDLFGQWRQTGSDTNYLSFAGSVALFRYIPESEGQVYGNFQHTGDSLFIQCFSAKAKQTDTIIVKNHFDFPSFNDIRVRIVTLDNDKMVLTKDDKIWNFDKY